MWTLRKKEGGEWKTVHAKEEEAHLKGEEQAGRLETCGGHGVAYERGGRKEEATKGAGVGRIIRKFCRSG